MLKIQLICGFYFLGLIFVVTGSNPETSIDETPTPLDGNAPNSAPMSVTSVKIEARSGPNDEDMIVNIYKEKRNGTCPVKPQVPTLNGPCTSDFFCRSIKFSKCSENFCKCLPGYVEAWGQCLGELESKCSRDFECAPASSVCDSETCKCPATHYAKYGNCYEFATRIGFPVYSFEACWYLKYSFYSSGSCQCIPGYGNANGQCLGKLQAECSEDFDCARPLVCSGTCQCPAGHFFEGGKCYEYLEKLNSRCELDNQCKVPFSECSKGECKCKSYDYAEHDNKCYGLLESKCKLPSDCAGLTLTCESEVCEQTFSMNPGKLMSSKLGTTAIWQHYLDLWGQPERHDHHLGEPGHNPGPDKAGNLIWTKNFTLDKLVLVHERTFLSNPSFITIFCRMKTTDGKFISGKINIPGNGLCKVDVNGIQYSTDDWTTLVDLGPI